MKPVDYLSHWVDWCFMQELVDFFAHVVFFIGVSGNMWLQSYNS